MSWIILVAFVLGAVFVIFWLVRFHLDGKFVVRCFERANVIVSGHKGSGKDLLFQYVISKRKKPHYSNIRYNEQTEVKDPKAFNIDPNTYRNFLDGNVIQIPKHLKEEMDYYLSDGGIFMPSTYQSDLVKIYPSLPLMYAIQRHLLNSNFHCNVQNLQRLWDKIREQADYYFWCCQSIRIGKRTFIQKLRYYENYEAAKANVLPFKVNRFLLMFNDKRQLALQHQFQAQNGNVRYVWILNHLPKDHYDTRHFHKVVYGYPAEENRAKKRKKSSKNLKRV